MQYSLDTLWNCSGGCTCILKYFDILNGCSIQLVHRFSPRMTSVQEFNLKSKDSSCASFKGLSSSVRLPPNAAVFKIGEKYSCHLPANNNLGFCILNQLQFLGCLQAHKLQQHGSQVTLVEERVALVNQMQLFLVTPICFWTATVSINTTKLLICSVNANTTPSSTSRSSPHHPS